MVKDNKTTKLTLSLFNLEGDSDKEIKLPKDIFDNQVKPELLAQYVRVYQANQRQGNASTKTRGDVTGSTRKIYRQKGTGRARHGDIKAPIFVGGGVVGGPKPKDYSLNLSKKQKNKALKGALSLKQKKGDILGLSNDFLKIEPKTKNFVKFLKKNKLEQGRKLVVLARLESNNLSKVVRNLSDVSIADAKTINTYQVLSFNKILFLEDSIAVLEKKLTNEG